MVEENNDDNLYLSSIDNYKEKYDSSINDVISVFADIIYDYLEYCEKSIYISNTNYLYYVIENGINLLHNIFTLIYTCTKNITLSKQYTERGYYIYCEFIGNVGENNHKYLQLNSKDAMIFVLKKTIYEINNPYTRNFTTDTNDITYIHDFTGALSLYIECVKIYLKIQHNIDILKENKDSKSIRLFPLKYLKKVAELIPLNKDEIEAKTESLKKVLSISYQNGEIYDDDYNNSIRYLKIISSCIGFNGFINNESNLSGTTFIINGCNDDTVTENMYKSLDSFLL